MNSPGPPEQNLDGSQLDFINGSFAKNDTGSLLSSGGKIASLANNNTSRMVALAIGGFFASLSFCGSCRARQIEVQHHVINSRTLVANFNLQLKLFIGAEKTLPLYYHLRGVPSIDRQLLKRRLRQERAYI